MEIVDKLLNHSRLALSKAITAVENEYDDAVHYDRDLSSYW